MNFVALCKCQAFRITFIHVQFCTWPFLTYILKSILSSASAMLCKFWERHWLLGQWYMVSGELTWPNSVWLRNELLIVYIPYCCGCSALFWWVSWEECKLKDHSQGWCFPPKQVQYKVQDRREAIGRVELRSYKMSVSQAECKNLNNY